MNVLYVEFNANEFKRFFFVDGKFHISLLKEKEKKSFHCFSCTGKFNVVVRAMEKMFKWIRLNRKIEMPWLIERVTDAYARKNEITHERSRSRAAPSSSTPAARLGWRQGSESDREIGGKKRKEARFKSDTTPRKNCHKNSFRPFHLILIFAIYHNRRENVLNYPSNCMRS